MTRYPNSTLRSEGEARLREARDRLERITNTGRPFLLPISGGIRARSSAARRCSSRIPSTPDATPSISILGESLIKMGNAGRGAAVLRDAGHRVRTERASRGSPLAHRAAEDHHRRQYREALVLGATPASWKDVLMKTRFIAVLAAALAAAQVHAADRLSGPQTAAACAPVPASTLRETALRIVGAQDVVVRGLYSARSLVVIAGGTARGLQPDQRYYIRREPTGRLQPSGPRVATTAGWLRIVSATETTAVGLVEFACDGVLAGDLLQPYADPAVPAGAELTAAVGEPDFKAAGRVLSGENERETGTRWRFLPGGCPTCRPVDRRAARHLSRSADAWGAAGGDCRCGGDRDLRRVVGRADHLRARCGPERRPGCAAAGALTYPALRRSRGMEISSTRRLSSWLKRRK